MREGLEKLLSELYGKDSEKILAKVEKLTSKSNAHKRKQTESGNLQLYVTYPDSLCDEKDCNIYSLVKFLPHIKNLGLNAIHILPLFKSPMIDAGFDVSDYLTVRKNLGSNEAFELLLQKAREINLNIFIDLVFNHISDKSDWFQKAVNGDKYYRDFFIHTKKKPKLIRKEKDKSGIWAIYDQNGKEIRHRIIFPEFCGSLPHWEKHKDGYYYYHTFYPSQIDLDWRNPNVFLAFLEIIHYWASKGLSFRLDAITFLGKEIEKGKIESSDFVYKALEAIYLFTKKVSEDSDILVETCQELDTIKGYFGNNKNKSSDLAYNFPLMNKLWNAILRKDINPIYTCLEKSYKNLPEHADWVTFLRNHDELSLEFCSDKERKVINKKLLNKGKSFRKEFGIAGRTFSFLDGDPKRVINAYFLLASVPGNPAIIYGDEIGKENDYEFMKKCTKSKRKLLNDKSTNDDTRDINRSKIMLKDKNIGKSKLIYNTISRIFQTRLKYGKYFKYKPKTIKSDKKIFSGIYSKNKELYVFVNLGDEKCISKNIEGKTILTINGAKNNNGTIALPKYSGIWIEVEK